MPDHIRVVTDSVGVINALLSFLALVIGVLFVSSLIRKSTLEILKSANEALEKAGVGFQQRISILESGYQAQERRIWRLEMDNERKGRLLNVAREEIRRLEQAVQIAVPCMSGIKGREEDYQRTLAVLSDLSEYRRTASRDQDDWEATTLSTMAWSERHTADGAMDNKVSSR